MTGFNALVISTGLDCRQIELLRALGKYLLQLQVPFSQKSIGTGPEWQSFYY